MAENDEKEQPLISQDEKAESSTATDEGAGKKTTKKRVVKKAVVKKAVIGEAVVKKVVRKRAATKKVVAKKVAVTAASDLDDAQTGKNGEGSTEAGVLDEGSKVARVATSELSEVSRSDVKAMPPVATGQIDISREEKVTMSAEETTNEKTKGSSGFLPKVIIWLVVVLAAFMYIRSLVHQGQTPTSSDNPAATAVSPLGGKSQSEDASSSSSSGLVSIQPSESTASALAKIGAVAVEQQPEQEISSANVNPPSAVPVAPIQMEKTDAADVATSSTAQATEEAKSDAVSESPVTESVITPSREPEQAPVAMTVEPPASASDSSSPPTAAATEKEASDIVVPSSGKDGSTTALTIEQPPLPVPTVVVDEQLQEVAGKVPEMVVDAVTTTGAENSAMAVPAVPQSQEAAQLREPKMVAAPDAKSADLVTRTKRPSFKELFGYERPQPPIRGYEYGSQGGYSKEGPETQRTYPPAPWQYAPIQPGWGADFPGRYWPYGNYGGYPAYPMMPDWAPYQPFEYGPSGY